MMLLSKAARAMSGCLLGDDAVFNDVGTDSRKVQRGELFFALKGEHFDGHQYAEQALKLGAVAVVVSDEACLARPAILVKDTLLALGEFAKAWRLQFNVPVIGVTGSNGKTTIKEMITAILVAKTGSTKEVLATVGNLNNHIGLPLTLLKMREHHQYAVLEMGMNHLGEIDYLTHIAKPTVALIGNAGTAHIGELGSRDNIAKAKGEIFAGLDNKGVAIINADDAYANYWFSLNVNRKVLSFGLKNNADVSARVEINVDGRQQIQLQSLVGEFEFSLDLMGEHNVRNALAACAVAIALNIPLKVIAQAFEKFGGVAGRLTRIAGFNGALVIDDTYNANPDSMKAAIDVLATQAGTKVMIMGDMAELGVDAPQLHAEIGKYAKQKGIEMFYTLGENSQLAAEAFEGCAQAFSEAELLVNAVKNKMNERSVVLVKGSRFMKMERIVNSIIQHPIYREAH
ncbi:MAG TPA: UDP-N-acetylmuramoyl-tripeptide--D-alanyl-D-alanine ligase [Methylotenera sp.]|nr:UDP-N-acetylmuramoyl-tripeptide--D-alanyl-D-alanine ligase [Methylotenera sp.]HPH05915.1 UDP-N-acetylmuramoyl-tripeptide--D-alanyl-D-alanine ligase [Methylotenera sp.]HPN00696.1 UDP-N-acetylmuramoyl-tripeptide--D-alanyl-D-alanine ligase [Methylotenera sp.]